MKRHDTDLVSLVFALVFLLVAALWPLWTVGLLDTESLRWVPASALVLIGIVGVTLSILRSRPVADDHDLHPVDLAYLSEPTEDTHVDDELHRNDR